MTKTLEEHHQLLKHSTTTTTHSLTTPPSGRTKMAALPVDIISDILSRLPVKSLLCFKSVSKSWYSLIKSPNFIKLHLNQTLISNSNRHLLLIDTSFKHADFDFSPNNLSFSELRHPLRPRTVHLHGSCNGVICISDCNNDNMFLYNPLTKSNHEVPFNSIPTLKYYFVMFGFGYDSRNEDYKVLRIVQEYKNKLMSYNESKVYSFNDDSWKRVEDICYNVLDSSSHGVLVNEVLHFIVFDEKMDYPPNNFIACFDLRNECFSYMDCPIYDDDEFRSKDMLHNLRELGGSLCHMVIYYTNDFDDILHPDNVGRWRQLCDTIMCRVDLWMMKEYGRKESWVKLFSIRQADPVWCGIVMNPIFYSKDRRKILLQVDTLWFGWFDLESKSVERYMTDGVSDEPFETGAFVGSLVSLQDNVHPRRLKKNDLDEFLSVGFKLKL